ncbi:MAG: formylglycine-generating enzyme family protein [Pirellulales bacterium]
MTRTAWTLSVVAVGLIFVGSAPAEMLSVTQVSGRQWTDLNGGSPSDGTLSGELVGGSLHARIHSGVVTHRFGFEFPISALPSSAVVSSAVFSAWETIEDTGGGSLVYGRAGDGTVSTADLFDFTILVGGVASGAGNGVIGPVTVDVTAIVQTLVSAAESFLVLSFKPDDGQLASSGAFRMQNFDSGGPNIDPRLTIVYTVPEPSTGILLAAGITVLVTINRRRRGWKTLMTTTGPSISSGKLIVFLCAGLLLTRQTATATPITIDTVPVQNIGNSDDTTGFGAVSYAYRIGTYEVTNAQYAAFLNAKAASDPLGLYNILMGTVHGGITRSGSSGSYSYAAISGREDMPVNYVSWYDSIRFANWLNNGQGSGDTETGAYTLLGGTATPSNGLSITRNVGATWFLTSEDEWYKAAYHKNDGDTANYFDYPTSSDTVPTAEGPPGGSNSANYSGAAGDLTDVGAYVDSDSPYGTFDQGGNVWEWNESLVSGSSRGRRGGSFSYDASVLSASVPDSVGPTYEALNVGFRVATVPEPSSLALAGSALLGGLLVVRRRRGR